MLYLFTGSDEAKVRAKAFAWVAAARAKEPNLAYLRLAREEVTDAALEDAAASGGLFVSRLLVLLDDPFAKMRASPEENEEDEGREGTPGASLVENHLEALASSDNAIVLLAPNLSAAKAKKIAAKAKMSYAFDRPARAEPTRGFNRALVDALARRSRENLWLEVVRALRAGDAPEMLHGLLHWKARDILEKGNPKWTRSDARALSRSLIALLLDARRRSLDLSTSLERFALSI